jgi:hypothetical protein
MTETWTELPDSEEFEHDGEPVGSDDDLDHAGYDAGDDPASQPPGTPSEPPVDSGAKGDGGIPFPVAKAAIPTWVKEHGNGEIPSERMIKVAPIASGFLVPEAAAAWRNLQNAAAAQGFTLTMTGSYRTFQGQKDLFEQRYTTSNTGRKSKVWNGTTYWLKPGMAMAAVPGTSNHGWGCAVDAALGGYGNAAQPVGEPFLSWAVANARQYGWSWEVQSEPWHLRPADKGGRQGDAGRDRGRSGRGVRAEVGRRAQGGAGRAGRSLIGTHETAYPCKARRLHRGERDRSAGALRRLHACRRTRMTTSR